MSRPGASDPRGALWDPFARWRPPARDASPSFARPLTEPSDASACPRISRVEEVIPAQRIFESDFKTPAGPSDVEVLVERLSTLAELTVAVSAATSAVGHECAWDIPVRAGREKATIRGQNHKYPDIASIVKDLNGVLATARSPYRFHFFDAEACSRGLLLADERETLELRAHTYVV